MSDQLKKKYGLFTAIAMVVGIVIGSGVFFKSEKVLQATGGDMPLGILAWLIGGVIMLFCALAFALMAGRYEKVNGAVDYAEATCGSDYAYMLGWFLCTIYYPSLTGVLAWVSARFTIVFITAVNPNFQLVIPIEEGGALIGPECMVIAAFYLIASYFINTLAPKVAGKFQVSATVIKLIPLILMAVVGTIYGLVNGITVENFTTVAAVSKDSVLKVSPLFAAVVAVAFAYDGWIVATSINAELKDSKKNLPLALVFGALIVICVYVLYYIGLAGGASTTELVQDATAPFGNIFGSFVSVILFLFITISCLGTLNGLMVGCTRGMYSLAARKQGPAHKVFVQVDEMTNMPANSSVVGLLLAVFWFLYFYGANLSTGWFGLFNFDSSELPIVSAYSMYIPIFVMFMVKAKDLSPVKRFVIPSLAVGGCLFMVISAVFSHGVVPYLEAKAQGKFSLPILFYLILFAVFMAIGALFMRKKEKR